MGSGNRTLVSSLRAAKSTTEKPLKFLSSTKRRPVEPSGFFSIATVSTAASNSILPAGSMICAEDGILIVRCNESVVYALFYREGLDQLQSGQVDDILAAGVFRIL